MTPSDARKSKVLGWRNDWGGKGTETQDLYSGVGYYRVVKPLQYLSRDKFEAIHFGRHPAVADEHFNQIPPHEVIPHLVSQSDLVFMKNVSSPNGIMQFVAPCEYYNIPLIVDMDDNYFAVDELHPDWELYKEGRLEHSVHSLLFRSATAMTVSTPPLVDIYKEFCPNIHVLPNFHDKKDWCYKKSIRKDGRFVIGWMGSQTHISDLMEIAEAYRQIWKKYGKRVVFLFCGGLPRTVIKQMFPGIPDEAYEIHSGTVDIWDYMPSVAKWAFDIGLAPLKRNAFNDGKAEGKWMEYASYKVPMVATNFGPYQREVRHGVDGFLCDTILEWVRAITNLIEEPETREFIGTNAYNEVIKNRQWESNAWRWEEVFSKYIGRGFKRAENPVV